MLLYTKVHKHSITFFVSLFFSSQYRPSTFISRLILDFSLYNIIWCNIISYRYSSDLLANYASTRSYRCVSYVYVHLLIVVFLSMHTVPYIYVHSLIVVSLIADFLSMHLIYMLTCRLSFSYLASRIYMLTCWLSCSYWLLMHPYVYAHSLIVVSHRCISRIYMLKRWLYYIYVIVFPIPSNNIDKWTCMHAKRNVLVMIKRIGGVSVVSVVLQMI
jgi:hypothetical protein